MRLEAIFFYLSSVIFGSGICKYPQAGISFSVTGRIMGKPSFVLIHLIQPYDAFDCVFEIRNKHIGFVPLIIYRKTKLYAL